MSEKRFKRTTKRSYHAPWEPLKDTSVCRLCRYLTIYKQKKIPDFYAKWCPPLSCLPSISTINCDRFPKFVTSTERLIHSCLTSTTDGAWSQRPPPPASFSYDVSVRGVLSGLKRTATYAQSKGRQEQKDFPIHCTHASTEFCCKKSRRRR
jgi:hypothetical protein